MTPVEPRLLRRQRGVRHLARPRRPGAGDAGRRRSRSTTTCARGWRPGTASTAAWSTCRPRRPRRRGRADPRQSRAEEDLHHHREDVGARRARDPRAWRQQNGIDIFGGNSLGVADSWNQVRIGGALGGDKPGETLQQGLDRDLLQLGRLHHHDRAVPAHGRLGHDDADLERQGRLHPLRRARVRLRARQRRRAARPRCSTASPAATTSATPTSPSRWWPAWSGAGRAS